MVLLLHRSYLCRVSPLCFIQGGGNNSPLSLHRGLAAGFYTTNGPEACQFVASDCKANIIVVENQKQLDKILQVSVGFGVFGSWQLNPLLYRSVTNFLTSRLLSSTRES